MSAKIIFVKPNGWSSSIVDPSRPEHRLADIKWAQGVAIKNGYTPTGRIKSDREGNGHAITIWVK